MPAQLLCTSKAIASPVETQFWPCLAFAGAAHQSQHLPMTTLLAMAPNNGELITGHYFEKLGHSAHILHINETYRAPHYTQVAD